MHIQKGMEQMTGRAKKVISLLFALCMVLALMPTIAFAATNFTIVNPYENVNWDAFGRYRAALHMHTTRSDGSATVAETILDLYNKGFDIIAVTDHSDVAEAHTGDWAYGEDALTASQRDAILAGTFARTEYIDFEFPGDFGPGFYRPASQGGMIAIPFANEQSRMEHINTFWANFSDESGWTMERAFEETRALGGIAFINHPGRYTTGAAGGAGGVASSNNPVRISRYVELFDRFYDVALGFELFNRNDNESRSDRVLWDNILQALMPYGHFVWGFSNDDSHSMNQAGFNWNVMLMPELTESNTRNAMETGAFYMVSRVNRGVGPTDSEINTILPDGSRTPNGGNPATIFMLHQVTPSIARISVNGSVISIEGLNYDRIEWVADGAIIHTGASIDVAAHQDAISSNYVRAQLISTTGAAYTQPFGVLPVGQSFRTRPATNDIVSLDEPQAVNVLQGAAATIEGLRLPANVTAVTERNWRMPVAVTWDLDNLDYDPTNVDGVQSFTVAGTIEENPALTAQISVTVGIDPRISIAEANATAVGTIITVEGYVTAVRTGDSHRIVIQDSTQPWGGLFIEDRAGRFNAETGEGSTMGHYVGEWVRITGTRGVQWHNNAIHLNTATGDGSFEVVSNENRPTIAPVQIELPELQMAVQGEWNNMLISISTEMVQRDAARDMTVPPSGYGMPNHILRSADEGRVDVQYELADHIQNGEMVHIDRAIVHWRNDLESHRLHPDWTGGSITTISAEPAAEESVLEDTEESAWEISDITRDLSLLMIWYHASGEGLTGSQHPHTNVYPLQFFADTYPAYVTAWAYEAGIIRGFTDGTFRPHETITAEHFYAMIERFEAYSGLSVNFPRFEQGLVGINVEHSTTERSLEWLSLEELSQSDQFRGYTLLVVRSASGEILYAFSVTLG